MSIEELTKAHAEAAQAIMANSPASETCDANARADELVVALRHLIAAWALSEATEADLRLLSRIFPE